MYKKSLLFLTVLIMLSVTFGTADAYLDSETGRFITQDPYLGEITRPPSVHRYNHVKSNPASFVDRNGYDYAEVRDNKAYWIIEKDIAGPFNPDTRRVYIGNTKENDPRNIYLTTESGGGMVDRKALKYAASKFWDRYDADEFSSVLNPADISSLSHLPEVQDQIITDHIGRLDPHQIGGIYADRPVFRSKLTNRLDRLQTAGDIAGAIPGAGIFADVPNTALYGLRGKWTDFGIGLAAAIPVFGQGAIAAKYGK
ncbi:MAG: hypothetical protein GY754_37975, partial [bacterium]|nr:hypothetical protein [bacterium]